MKRRTETVLAEIWREILCVDAVDASDDFFLLGGDSLDAMRVVLRAEEAGLLLTVDDVVKARSLRALATEIDAKES
jgi:acyl carrier protein